jgi:hypothetical protein
MKKVTIRTCNWCGKVKVGRGPWCKNFHDAVGDVVQQAGFIQNHDIDLVEVICPSCRKNAE